MLDSKLRALALAKLHANQLDAARPVWSRLCEIEPGDIDNWLILATIDENLGFLPAALGHLNLAFRLDANDNDVWLKSAQIKWKMRNFSGAIGDISHALSLDFTDVQIRLQFANWLFQLRRFDLAFVQYSVLCRAPDSDDEVLVDALSCLVCQEQAPAANKELAQRWQALDLKHAETIKKTVVSRIQNCQPPGHWPVKHDFKNGYSPAFDTFLNSIVEMLYAGKERFDWQNHYESIAHTQSELMTSEEHKTTRALSDLICKRVKAWEGDYTHILEFGCDTGLLGEHLKSTYPNLLLTGVAYCDATMRVVNGANQYDTLIHQQRFPELNRKVLHGVNCVVVQPRASHYESLTDLTNALIQNVPLECAIVIVYYDADTDRDSITKTHPQIVGQSNWHRLGKASDKISCLVIDGTGDSNVDEAKEYSDPLEKAGNTLINASTNLKKSEFQQSEKESKEALSQNPFSAQALFNRGLGAQHSGDQAKALSFYRRARVSYSGYADNWFQIASIHHQRNNLQAAFNCYRKCLSFAPSHLASMQNMISLHFAQDDIPATWQVLNQMLVHHPLNDQILERVHKTVEESKNKELAKLHDEFLASVDWVKIRFNAAIQAKYFVRAARLFKEIEAHQKDRESEFMHAQLEDKSGALQLAKQRLLTLQKAHPENDLYSTGIASICADQGQLDEAYHAWLEAKKVAKIENQNLQNFLFFANYCQFIDDELISKHHLDWGRELAKALACGEEPKKVTRQKPHSTIRVGYVSGDFRMHSVSMFLYNILKHHDKDKFTIYCYSTSPSEDSMTIKLRYFSEYWRNVASMKNEDIVQRILADEIDILVDIAGHTAGNRLPVFAHRPAPVQCTYLGYPNTTGLEQIDYRLTDKEADPVGESEHLHSETLVRLPNGILNYSRHLTSTPITLYEKQSNLRRYTFACCNNIFKVNEHVVSVFCKILKHLPNATLLLKAHNLNNSEILDHYRSLFEAEGIGEDQVHLMNTIDVDEHQNLYNNIDIALDPFPYNGTTTTCDTLWMGVPVLTLAGTRHSGRVGVSILTRVGLENWIAQDEQEYIDKAVMYAKDTGYVAQLKRTMRERLLKSPLMKPGLVTKDVEAAYSDMWDKYASETENAKVQ